MKTNIKLHQLGFFLLILSFLFVAASVGAASTSSHYFCQKTLEFGSGPYFKSKLLYKIRRQNWAFELYHGAIDRDGSEFELLVEVPELDGRFYEDALSTFDSWIHQGLKVSWVDDNVSQIKLVGNSRLLLQVLHSPFVNQVIEFKAIDQVLLQNPSHSSLRFSDRIVKEEFFSAVFSEAQTQYEVEIVLKPNVQLQFDSLKYFGFSVKRWTQKNKHNLVVLNGPALHLVDLISHSDFLEVKRIQLLFPNQAPEGAVVQARRDKDLIRVFKTKKGLHVPAARKGPGTQFRVYQDVNEPALWRLSHQAPYSNEELTARDFAQYLQLQNPNERFIYASEVLDFQIPLFDGVIWNEQQKKVTGLVSLKFAEAPNFKSPELEIDGLFKRIRTALRGHRERLDNFNHLSSVDKTAYFGGQGPVARGSKAYGVWLKRVTLTQALLGLSGERFNSVDNWLSQSVRLVLDLRKSGILREHVDQEKIKRLISEAIDRSKIPHLSILLFWDPQSTIEILGRSD